MFHYYYGDGKGKTSAAAGLALRAAGWGQHVLFAQFLKRRESGECNALRMLPSVRVLRAEGADKFVRQMTRQEKEEQRQAQDFFAAQLFKLISEDPVDVLILDEAGTALESGVLSESSLLPFFDFSKEGELVITGHKRLDFLAQRSDYCTQFCCEKHPYQQGVPARKGIEF